MLEGVLGIQNYYAFEIDYQLPFVQFLHHDKREICAILSTTEKAISQRIYVLRLQVYSFS